MNDGRAIVYGSPLALSTDSARQRATRYGLFVCSRTPSDERYTNRGLLPDATAARISIAVSP
jgi:hypothetical protein